MIKYADKIDAIVNYFRYVFKQNKQCHHINYLPHIKIILNKFDLDILLVLIHLYFYILIKILSVLNI